MRYCEEIFGTIRRKTREVLVGSVGIGGDNPIRIQSMTTSSTRDVDATVSQILRLKEAGCEIVRMTVQGMKEAEACEDIANQLIRKGYKIPLVADIHFYPPAAMKAVEFVDKIRINPGNFADKRALFIQRSYEERAYLAELEKLEETFVPLVEKCKSLKKALRIGTNQGSLSDRIMNRYGDTPQGMVESALEFTRICRKYDFHELVFSMKSSNPLVMIQAYRLLAAEMLKLGWDYPFHLGVTEAGEGEDGRIKSSLGIGTLLLDGIGETVRVSLTEDPWREIDPCQRMIAWAEGKCRQPRVPFSEKIRDPYSWQKSPSVIKPPLHPEGSVLMKVSQAEALCPDFFQGWDLHGVDKPDLLWIPEISREQWESTSQAKTLRDAHIEVLTQEQVVFLEEADKKHSADQVLWIRSVEEKSLNILLEHAPKFFIFSGCEGSFAHQGRRLFAWMQEKQIHIPVLLLFIAPELSTEDALIHSSVECGSLLISGMFDGICLDIRASFLERKKMSFAILQAARKKATKTEFISCPGCGRTLFDLQSVSKRIRDRTSHLPGVRIAIMGCIVNGPGEMADADFGYVGSRAGKIDLYVGKQCVEKNIDFADADERLISLIKSCGKWVDPVIS